MSAPSSSAPAPGSAADPNACNGWRPYDAVRSEGSDRPWSGVDQQRAFLLLRDVLEAVSAGPPAVDALRTRAADNPNDLFKLDVATTHARGNQDLCAEVLDVLLDDRRRISTQRLGLFLDTFVRTEGSGGKRLPFFLRHADRPWSWFVRDLAAAQDSWYGRDGPPSHGRGPVPAGSVRVLMDLGEMDDTLLPLMGLGHHHAPPPPPWGLVGSEEARLREELTSLRRLARYLFDLERHARGGDDDDDDAPEDGPARAEENDRVLEEAILRVLRGVVDARRRAAAGHLEDRILDPWSGTDIALPPPPYHAYPM